MPRIAAVVVAVLAATLVPAPAGAALFHDGFDVRAGLLTNACNASDVFRLNTRAHHFGDVRVGFDLVNVRLTSSDRTPPEDRDGVHVWLHYQSEFELYYASFDRRDGRIVVKKKCAGGSTNGGTYYELGPGEVPGYPIHFGRWKHVSAAVHDNADGSVTITMRRNGRRLLRITDRGVGCAPITAPGAVGIRGTTTSSGSTTSP
jgi:hypothetical protein